MAAVISGERALAAGKESSRVAAICRQWTYSLLPSPIIPILILFFMRKIIREDS